MDTSAPRGGPATTVDFSLEFRVHTLSGNHSPLPPSRLLHTALTSLLLDETVQPSLINFNNKQDMSRALPQGANVGTIFIRRCCLSLTILLALVFNRY